MAIQVSILYLTLALLLANYHCHESILRLPSSLFFKSTLQVRANSELHPNTSSALHFVCTSMNKSAVVSTNDYNEQEVRLTLEQVCPLKLFSCLVVQIHNQCYLCR